SVASFYDQVRVLIALDGGAFNALPAATNTTGGTLKDTSGAWKSASFDLSSFAPHKVQLRFSFDSVDGYANNYEGWYLDDIRVGSSKPIAADATFTANAGVTKLGSGVTGLGAFNGDGQDYFAATSANSIYVVRGQGSFAATGTLSSVTSLTLTAPA